MYEWTNGAYKYLLEDETSDWGTQTHCDRDPSKPEYFSEIQRTSTTPPRKTMRDYIIESNTHIETRRKTMGEYRNEAKLNNHPGKTLRDYRIENNMSVPPSMVGGVQQQKERVNSSQPVKTMRDHLYGYAYQPSYNSSSYNAYGLNWENHHSPCSRE